jgi:hypothetical protein
MNSVITSQCKFCSKKLNKPSNCYRHMRRVHGYNHFRKRQLLMSDGEYKCCMHGKHLRFLNRAALKQHLYFMHREDDQRLLSKHRLDKTIIAQRGWVLIGTLNEYRKAKMFMENLNHSGGCLREEILNMEILNQELEIMDREQKIRINYNLYLGVPSHHPTYPRMGRGLEPRHDATDKLEELLIMNISIYNTL